MMGGVEGYLTLEELAEYLGLKSTGSLRVQIARGALKAERIGKRTLIVAIAEADRYRKENLGRPGQRSGNVEPKSAQE